MGVLGFGLKNCLEAQARNREPVNTGVSVYLESRLDQDTTRERRAPWCGPVFGKAPRIGMRNKKD